MFGKKKVDKKLLKFERELARANAERIGNRQKKKEEDEALKTVCKSYRVSKSFVIVLALVSILGFIGIITRTLYNANIDGVIESLWFIIMGIGFIVEAKPLNLFKKIDSSLDQRNFASMTTLVVGLMALVAGILRVIGVETLVFSAIQGLISIIAIIFIIIETWVLKG
jgi:hypothetical protein